MPADHTCTCMVLFDPTLPWFEHDRTCRVWRREKTSRRLESDPETPPTEGMVAWCDWPGCDTDEGIAWRWHDDWGWLTVCSKHATADQYIDATFAHLEPAFSTSDRPEEGR